MQGMHTCGEVGLNSLPFLHAHTCQVCLLKFLNKAYHTAVSPVFPASRDVWSFGRIFLEPHSFSGLNSCGVSAGRLSVEPPRESSHSHYPVSPTWRFGAFGWVGCGWPLFTNHAAAKQDVGWTANIWATRNHNVAEEGNGAPSTFRQIRVVVRSNISEVQPVGKFEKKGTYTFPLPLRIVPRDGNYSKGETNHCSFLFFKRVQRPLNQKEKSTEVKKVPISRWELFGGTIRGEFISWQRGGGKITMLVWASG